MSTPQDNLNAITDKFAESENLLLVIKTPDRGVIESLMRHAMAEGFSEKWGLEITGLHFDAVPVRTSDIETIAGTLETLREIKINTDPHSLQIA